MRTQIFRQLNIDTWHKPQTLSKYKMKNIFFTKRKKKKEKGKRHVVGCASNLNITQYIFGCRIHS